MPDDLPPVSDDPPTLAQHVLQQRWRLAAFDQWREEIGGRVSRLESEIVTERSARQLREALAQHGQLRLTRWQQLAGVAIGLVALVDLVHGFVG